MIGIMKYFIFISILVFPLFSHAQFDLKAFDKTSGVIVTTNQQDLLVRWPAGPQEKA
jgi:hypothetical protein